MQQNQPQPGHGHQHPPPWHTWFGQDTNYTHNDYQEPPSEQSTVHYYSNPSYTKSIYYDPYGNENQDCNEATSKDHYFPHENPKEEQDPYINPTYDHYEPNEWPQDY